MATEEQSGGRGLRWRTENVLLLDDSSQEQHGPTELSMMMERSVSALTNR